MKTTRSLAVFLALALLGFVFLVLAAPTAHANPGILRVTVSGATSGLSCGTSWANPCGLQYALTAVAQVGDELWVAAGTYTPTTGADRYATFQLRSGIALYGGFAMTETLRTQRDITANLTILSGDIDQNDTANPATNSIQVIGNNSYHVLSGSSTASTAVLDGFTVTAGKANASGPYSFGGGMYNYYGSPTVRNITFSGNSVSNAGGGMYNYYSHPTLTNVTFSGNWADNAAGGMFVERSNPTLTNVTFAGNTANGEGGGGMVNHNYSYPTLTDVTFSGDSASFRGGGMYNLDHSSPMLINITFSNNDATHGGGMYNVDASNPALANVTFFDNSAAHGGGMYNSGSSPVMTNVTFFDNSAGAGGGMYNYYPSAPTVRNAIFWGNIADPGSQILNSGSAAIIYDSVVQGGYPGGTNIIDRDPLLGALGDWGGSTQTFPLLPGSSAIDAGDDGTCAPTDQRGSIRYGAHCDAGAFESRGFTLTKTSGDNQSTLVNTPFATALGVDVSSVYGDPVDDGFITFTAPSSGASATPTTNTVTIAGGAVSQTMTANGILGSYGVTANASGATASATFVLTNAKANTTTVITSSENPVLVSHPVTFTVTVSAVAPATATPTGTVELYETTSPSLAARGTRRALASHTLVDGVATFTVPSLTEGAHTLLAVYDGDANCNASTSALYTQNAYLLDYYFPVVGR